MLCKTVENVIMTKLIIWFEANQFNTNINSSMRCLEVIGKIKNFELQIILFPILLFTHFKEKKLLLK